MVWTPFTRVDHDRSRLRYASDLSDAEWTLLEPHMPPPGRVGRPRTTDLREVVDALLYMTTTDCQWRMLPRDFPPYTTVQPPYTTVQGYFYAWRVSGLLEAINHHLVMAARELEGREASPTAGPFLGCAISLPTVAMPDPSCAAS